MSIMPSQPCMFCQPLVARLEENLEYTQRRYEALIYVADQTIDRLGARIAELEAIIAEPWRGKAPVDLVLHCPACGKQHLDIGEFQTRVHRKHLCENTPDGPGTGCGHLWVPCEYATRGVEEVVKPEDS